MNTVFLLIVLFQLKHFLADYPLQGKYMLGKFRETGWFIPLASHAAVHAIFTLLITYCVILATVGDNLYYGPFGLPLWFGLFDFITHFTMDRIKASPNMLGRFKDFYDRRFWWSLGFDQMIHHLSDTVIIYVLVRYLLG